MPISSLSTSRETKIRCIYVVFSSPVLYTSDGDIYFSLNHTTLVNVFWIHNAAYAWIMETKDGNSFKTANGPTSAMGTLRVTKSNCVGGIHDSRGPKHLDQVGNYPMIQLRQPPETPRRIITDPSRVHDPATSPLAPTCRHSGGRPAIRPHEPRGRGAVRHLTSVVITR